ncbi:MAG: LemA family protein, partial [Betaproteobacteria bacterium]|nr:LemA family protein [Betaproteobacteria bacterium]
MTAHEDIRRLIQEGKIPDEEGLRLLEAFEAAEARDRVIQAELRQARTSRHGLHIWTTFSVGLLLVALGWLVIGTVLVPRATQESSAHQAQAARQLLGQDLDLAIDTLERKLRQPGSAMDYWKLGMAYEKRYELSQAAPDRHKAAEALARAERLERRTPMKVNPGVFGLFFVLVIVTAIVVWVMLMYNGLAKSDERVNERWAQVETVLQRRLDLIPQLVESVRGYAAHERQTLIAVTEARARVLGILQGTGGTAPKSAATVEELNQAQQGLSGALKQLLALAEQYPDLKASANFVTLQDQLEGTENRIAVERQRY